MGVTSPSFPGPRRMAGAFRGTMICYFLVIPPFLLILLFVVYPTVEAFRDSFFRESGQTSVFVGVQQYARLARSGVFWNALANTALLGTAFLAIVVPLAAVLASLLNRVVRAAA